MDKPTLYLLSGPPGSGKSTKAKQLRQEHPDAVYLSTDEFIERYARFIGRSYNDVFQKAVKKATKRLAKLIELAKKRNLDVIWDQTNLTMEDRRNKAYKFDTYNQVLHYAHNHPISVLLERNKTRDRSPLNEIIMRKMFALYQYPSTQDLTLWDEAYEFGT